MSSHILHLLIWRVTTKHDTRVQHVNRNSSHSTDTSPWKPPFMLTSPSRHHWSLGISRHSTKNLRPEYVGIRPCNNNQHHNAKAAVSKKWTTTRFTCHVNRTSWTELSVSLGPLVRVQVREHIQDRLWSDFMRVWNIFVTSKDPQFLTGLNSKLIYI